MQNLSFAISPLRNAIGHSSKLRLLFVNFTERVKAIRIFSARKATTKERMLYEENADYDPDNTN